MRTTRRARLTLWSLGVLLICSAGAAPRGRVRHYECRNALVRLITKGEIPELTEVDVSDMHVAEYLPNLIQSPYKTAAGMREKPIVIPGAAHGLRNVLDKQAPTIIDHAVHGDEFLTLIQPNHKYTYVLQDKKMSFAPAIEGGELENTVIDYLSKHYLLADGKPVRFAGEMWVEILGDGSRVLHMNNDSGTFMPPVSALEDLKRFFHDQLHIDIVVHDGDAKKPPSMPRALKPPKPEPKN